VNRFIELSEMTVICQVLLLFTLWNFFRGGLKVYKIRWIRGIKLLRIKIMAFPVKKKILHELV